MEDAACQNSLTSPSWWRKRWKRSGPGQRGFGWTEQSVAVATRRRFCSRVRRVDGYLAAVALAPVIERLKARRGKKTHAATKAFQALRIAVNDEIGSLERGLAGALRILKSGGRLAVLTFHSVEDRVVKDFGRARAREYTFTGGMDVPELREPRTPELKWVSRKAIKAGAAELAENPRSRSAQLRVFEKV